MPKFFVDEIDLDEGVVIVKDDDARHIARSLRMAVGEQITASDKRGTDYICRLERIRDDRVECSIIEAKKSLAESPLQITLFMGFPKADKLETVIQKAVELGACRVQPFESSRCIKRPSQDKAEKLVQRYSRIAEEAAKQCGRSTLPTVGAPIGYNAALEAAKESDLILFCYEGEGATPLSEILEGGEQISSCAVFVGPEGGFSPEEASLAEKAGARIANLGPRILRCETAPMYVLSAISYVFELKK